MPVIRSTSASNRPRLNRDFDRWLEAAVQQSGIRPGSGGGREHRRDAAAILKQLSLCAIAHEAETRVALHGDAGAARPIATEGGFPPTPARLAAATSDRAVAQSWVPRRHFARVRGARPS